MVNLDKSGILSSSNTRNDDKVLAMFALNIHRQLKNENYPGLPFMIGRSKRKEFRTIKERLWSCIKN